VGPGVYRGVQNHDLDFGGKDLVLRSTAGAGQTIIDCQRAGRGFRFQGQESANAVVEGFTVRNGRATWGGALYCSGAEPTFRSCTFRNNEATTGGAFYLSADADLALESCRFFTNSASNSGGGLYLGDASPTLSGCEFSGNEAVYGGAIYCSIGGEPEISGGSFTGNTATEGGGLYCYWSDPVVTDCLFTDNTASAGAGFFCYSAEPVLAFCTIAHNHGDGLVMMDLAPSLTNCVLAFNSPGHGIECRYTPRPQIDHCCVYGNAETGDLCGSEGDNLSSDPLFCDMYHGRFEVCTNSPCLPANNPWGETVGATGGGCVSCSTSPVARSSWGRLKAMYR